MLGLGLMGGSLVRGLSASGLARAVTGWSPRSVEREGAEAAGAVDLAPADWRDAIRGTDLVVLAVPLGVAVELLPAIAQSTPDTTTLSDVASLKAPLADAARASGAIGRWVGSHPMAGGEASGFAASTRNLYEGARVWTVSVGARPEHAARVERLWRGLGAEPVPVEADEHDRLMERVSHVPQLVSNALASVLEARGVEAVQLGPGGRDMTRLASSSASMWLDLIGYASDEVADALRSVSAEAERVAEMVERRDMRGLETLFERTRRWKEAG
ncbi:MAG: prephenate dehydrogenase [Longimicrobiales bacterium]|nr:prephenate dehydrogenase [Longimicrobiales bacterium]